MTAKITVLKGDGIGSEIIQSALDILAVAASYTNFTYTLEEAEFGGSAIDQFQHPFPEQTKRACQEADAILLGAIGGPKWEQAPITPEAGLLELRQALGLYANIRPVKLHHTLCELSPLKPSIVAQTDLVIVRELIGGLYFGKPKYHTDTEAIDTLYYSRESIEKIVRVAFELAMTRRKKLTSIDKANVLASSKLWRHIVNEIKQEYPEVSVTHLYVDAAAMQMITEPTAFDVIVTENLFGDILSDEASVISGSLGMLPSASLSLQGTSLYEPIHGSAPNIAGLGIANPMSAILSVTMMLRQSFNQRDLADNIESSAYAVMDGGIRTKDLGGTATTEEFTKAVIQIISKGK